MLLLFVRSSLTFQMLLFSPSAEFMIIYYYEQSRKWWIWRIKRRRRRRRMKSRRITKRGIKAKYYDENRYWRMRRIKSIAKMEHLNFMCTLICSGILLLAVIFRWPLSNWMWMRFRTDVGLFAGTSPSASLPVLALSIFFFIALEAELCDGLRADRLVNSSMCCEIHYGQMMWFDSTNLSLTQLTSAF